MIRLFLVTLLCVFVSSGSVLAKSNKVKASATGMQRYVVEFHEPALANYRGSDVLTRSGSKKSMAATSPSVTGARKLDVHTEASKIYLNHLDEQFEGFRGEATLVLGRELQPTHRYRNAMNGFAAMMTAEEAAHLANMPEIKTIKLDTIHKLHTDSGPSWIGAPGVWNGQNGFPSTRGEGVVVGVIDSGINWEHTSFQDVSGDNFNHTNPRGQQFGLCSDPDVACNDKLIGVYDFVQPDGDPDVVEENTKGRDNDGHGSHVASIAVGNVAGVTINGSINATISGVAPRANLISYRVCYIGDENDPEDDGCQGSAIQAAIDQAITDGVDVINYSIGTNAFSPWSSGGAPQSFLNAFEAGIFVATSAGNDGPNASTMGSPANAPWIMAVGNASHDRVFGTQVQNLSGGNTAPPSDVIGGSFVGGSGVRNIVHAKDFGFALCGTGAPQLGSTCASNTGQSNPWQGQVFNGEIVVCDRGTYGRIEKGKNVMLAGAGGFILANTDSTGETINDDEHCLPATHIGDDKGDELRTWLDSGSNHQGSISSVQLQRIDSVGDILAGSSSRGPVLPPVEDIMKPNVIAPGSAVGSTVPILGASPDVGSFSFLSGTSMASPHVAGAAALILAQNSSWDPDQVTSALQTTATAEQARDTDETTGTPHEVGAGRVRVDVASTAGIYLPVTAAQFRSANPALGGEPKNLNLPEFVDSACKTSCTFTRTFADMKGGGTWNLSAEGLPAGVTFTPNMNSFSLGNGGTQQVNFTLALNNPDVIGNWVYGSLRLSSAGSPDAVLPIAVFASGGSLPAEWVIDTDRNGGSQSFTLNNLVELPDATYQAAGLVRPNRSVQQLTEDVTPQNPFDNNSGTFTIIRTVLPNTLLFHAETLASTSNDLDLFVGLDSDQDGLADESELICSSTSSDELELCQISSPAPGSYWIRVQNFDGVNNGGDTATLLTAVVNPGGNLMATGKGILPEDATVPVKVSWTDVNALSGDSLIGAVGIGSTRNSTNNIGVIPVRFNRTGIEAPETVALMNGVTRSLAIQSNTTHNRIFVDVPPSATEVNISVSGADGAQSNALSVELIPQDINAISVPFADPAPNATPLDTASGSNGTGPSVSVSGNPIPSPGRWYLVVRNNSGSAASITIETEIKSEGAASVNPHLGLWDFDRSIAQGIEFQALRSFRFILWYSYDDDGQPTFYIASSNNLVGDTWTAELLRITNDGANQQETVIGNVAVNFFASNQAVYSYTLFGESGSDSMHPNTVSNTCPVISGTQRNYTGHWYRGTAGLGGATVLVYANAQAQIHYLFDDEGSPRWIIAADDNNQSATATQIPILQATGFCPTCTPTGNTFTDVGTLTRTFVDNETGTWTLDFTYQAPLSLTVNRTDNVQKLSEPLVCQ